MSESESAKKNKRFLHFIFDCKDWPQPKEGEPTDRGYTIEMNDTGVSADVFVEFNGNRWWFSSVTLTIDTQAHQPKQQETT